MTKGRWPFPGDSPIAAARKAALAYRALAFDLAEALEKAKAGVWDGGLDPLVAVSEMDKRMRDWGQQWVDPSPTSYEPDDMVTAQEAGALIGLHSGTVSSLRLRGRIPGVWDKQGRRFLYRVSDVYELQGQLRRRKPSPTVRVIANGRGVS